MIFNKMNQFFQRLTMSSILLVILFGAIYFSAFPSFQPIFTLITAAAIGGALWEFYHIAKGKGLSPAASIGIIATICFVYLVFLNTQIPTTGFWLPVVFLVALAAAFVYYLFFRNQPLINLSVTLFGLIYLTFPLSYIIPINFVHGRWWFLYLLLVTKMTDTGAYFAGKILGRHKLAPTISPAKTWEGAIGGTLSGVLVSLFFMWATERLYPNEQWISLWQAIILGFGLSFLAQLGDFAESLIKRDAGVKDSNHLPGLGGMLDMLDSLVFTTPVLYYFLEFSK